MLNFGWKTHKQLKLKAKEKCSFITWFSWCCITWFALKMMLSIPNLQHVFFCGIGEINYCIFDWIINTSVSIQVILPNLKKNILRWQLDNINGINKNRFLTCFHIFVYLYEIKTLMKTNLIESQDRVNNYGIIRIRSGSNFVIFFDALPTYLHLDEDSVWKSKFSYRHWKPTHPRKLISNEKATILKFTKIVPHEFKWFYIV